MLKSTGLVLTAGGIAAANDALFVPIETHKPIASTFNWRIIPATIILALTLGGLEKISEPLGKGLAGLALLAVLVMPVGKGPSPLESAASFMKGVNATQTPAKKVK